MDLRLLIVSGLLVALGVSAFLIFQVEPNTQQADTRIEVAEAPLFERLGGAPAIAAVVETFANRLFDDPELEPFFGSLNETRQQRFIDLNIDFICQATGGPCVYTGRSMFDAHRGMGTSNDVFDVVFNHLVTVLNDFDVPRPLQRELLLLVESTRSDIVEE